MIALAFRFPLSAFICGHTVTMAVRRRYMEALGFATVETLLASRYAQADDLLHLAI